MDLYFITAKDPHLITFSCLTAQRVWMMVGPDAHVCEWWEDLGCRGGWGGGKEASVTPVDKCLGWQMCGQGQQPKHESSVLRQEGKEGGWDVRTSHYLTTWWHHPFLSLLERVVILDFGGLVNQAAGLVILQFEEVTALKLLIFFVIQWHCIYFHVYFSTSTLLHFRIFYVLCK